MSTTGPKKRAVGELHVFLQLKADTKIQHCNTDLMVHDIHKATQNWAFFRQKSHCFFKEGTTYRSNWEAEYACSCLGRIKSLWIMCKLAGVSVPATYWI